MSDHGPYSDLNSRRSRLASFERQPAHCHGAFFAQTCYSICCARHVGSGGVQSKPSVKKNFC